MNSYKLTFVNDVETNPVMLEFVDEDVEQFDISFNSKFSYQEFSTPFNQVDDKSKVKCQVSVNFKIKEDNFNKLNDLFVYLNEQMSNISEILIYKNDNLICDLNNIIDISSHSSILDRERIVGFNLNICEGV